MKTEPFELEIELSAGKKSFTVIPENNAFTLMESGSIVAVVKKDDNSWKFTKGSYSEDDAEKIGKRISELD